MADRFRERPLTPKEQRERDEFRALLDEFAADLAYFAAVADAAATDDLAERKTYAIQGVLQNIDSIHQRCYWNSFAYSAPFAKFALDLARSGYGPYLERHGLVLKALRGWPAPLWSLPEGGLFRGKDLPLFGSLTPAERKEIDQALAILRSPPWWWTEHLARPGPPRPPKPLRFRAKSKNEVCRRLGWSRGYNTKLDQLIRDGAVQFQEVRDGHIIVEVLDEARAFNPKKPDARRLISDENPSNYV